jgi:hypothetical protein
MLALRGYRRILPLANLLLFAVLISIGYLGSSNQNKIPQDFEIAHSSQAEGWQPTYIQRPTPLTHLFAWSLNFPAMLFASPFGLLAKGHLSDVIVNSIGALYLLVLWYVVGLWLDRRSDTSRILRKTPILQAIRWTAFLVSSVAFILVVALVIARMMLREFPETICTLPMLFWPVFLAYAARWEIVRARYSVQETVSA